MPKKKQRSTKEASPSSNNRPLVDVVVPVYGRVDLLKTCLDALPAAIGDVPHRLIIVDDGTPDTSVQDFLETLEISARKLVMKENKGYPAAVNTGVNHGVSPLVIVLTTDVVMQPGSLVVMVKELDDPAVGVVGPKLLFPPGATNGPPERIQHAGIAFNINGRPFHIFMGWEPTHPKVNRRLEVAAVTGACFATRRQLFTQLKGLNEVYGKGTYEDMEYCFLVRTQLGKQVIYAPDAWGYHHVGASAGQGYPLNRNAAIFKANVGNLLEWDEWKYW